METEVIGWVERPGYSGVVVKEEGRLLSLDFTKINQLLDKVDKKTWGELCWQRGYAEGRRAVQQENDIPEPAGDALKV